MHLVFKLETIKSSGSILGKFLCKMERRMDKVAVVTGASAGIGAEIAVKLVEAGFNVVGLARRKHLIEQMSEKLKGRNTKLYALAADITKEEDIIKSFEWIKTNIGPIHVLINNAGIAGPGYLYNGNSNMWKEVLDTNILGLCIATREAIKDMMANNIDGHIVHLNSVAGHNIVNFPEINVYQASKHAVTALTETLRQELNSVGSKIKITSISPGYVRTNVLQQAATESGLPAMPESWQETLRGIPCLQTSDVADAVLYVLSTPPHVQVHELMIRPIGERL